MVNTVSKTPAPQAPTGAPETWEHSAIRRVHLLHSQLDVAIARARKSNVAELRDMDFLGADSPYVQRLFEFYRENLGIARLLDSSDLLLHAEGPGAADHSPSLSAVNWLCTGAEKHIKHLLSAMLPMSTKDGRAATRELDLRLTGLAPGSLYAGFALEGLSRTPNESVLSDSDKETVLRLRQSIHALPVVPQFVGTEKMDREIMEALPDPALRDAAIVAAYELAPTGQRGIHTVEISSPRSCEAISRTPQALSQKERVVLREALRGDPMMRKTKAGSFTGVLRAIDLDTNRITLRQVSNDIPALRGALNLPAVRVKALLDQTVRIEGVYECNEADQPRMMRVDKIEAVARELPLDSGINL